MQFAKIENVMVSILNHNYSIIFLSLIEDFVIRYRSGRAYSFVGIIPFAFDGFKNLTIDTPKKDTDELAYLPLK